MFKFVLRKMLNKKWLVAALLIGNVLLTAIAASSPMYTRASLQRMLTTAFSDYVEENGRYASTAYLVATLNEGARPEGANHTNFLAEDALAHDMASRLGIEARHVLSNISLENVSLVPAGIEETQEKDAAVTARVGWLSGLEDHSKMLSGRMYSPGVGEDGVIEAVVSERAMVGLRVYVGEEFTVNKLTLRDGSPLKIRITGVFESDGLDDSYWYKSPATFTDKLFMSESSFKAIVGDYSGLPVKVIGLWFVILDYNRITVDNARYIYDSDAEFRLFHKSRTNASYYSYYTDILEAYITDSARISVTLRILQIPIYALLAAFIFMVSGQIVGLESSEIAVIKSRGSSRRQILLIYLLQSSVIAIVSLALGIPLAALICQILGSANAFLEFVSRKALKVEFTSAVFAYAAAGAVLSVAAMVIPAFRLAKMSIVGQKQKKRNSDRPLWQRLFLDVILLAVSLYGLYTYNGQKELLALKVEEGAGLDPLLFLSSSLFIIACGLISLRVIPAVVWLIYRIGKKRWTPALYASFLWVLRSKGSQRNIIAFLVITLAIGIFNAQTARTVNSNEEDRIRYTVGTDIVLEERWKSNIEDVAEDETGTVRLTYYEPDSRKYYEMEGAELVTRVIYDGKASCASADNKWTSVTVMGINTKEFGQAAYFKTKLMPIHWYKYLNAMARSPNAVLVSSNMAKKLGYKLGDTITYQSAGGFNSQGIIYGFVDYWPSYNPTVRTTASDGTVSEKDNYLVVANFSYVQSRWGVTPYRIWMRAAEDTDFIYSFIAENDISFTYFRDSTAEIIELKNDPIYQGTNGILTVGFAVVLVLCSVGFLIYWVMSIRGRELLFGIFRAMGMTMREILQMLINEQIFITGISVLLGVGAGLLASRLYIPLVQIAYADADTVIPLEIVSLPGDLARLLIVVAAVIVVCMILLGTLIRRIKISQALKLGEE
ncbi:MAG: FtsX-like permease family protein [Clostridiales bacterium]|nr:FtsX-like permease family protein [Clostridiales bacterium]